MRTLTPLKQFIIVAAILVLAYFGVMPVLMRKIKQDNGQQQAKLQETREVNKNSLHPDVNIISSAPQGQVVLPHKDCIKMPGSVRQDLYICVHPVKNDIWISGALKSGKLWEDSLIQEMMVALKADQRLQLIDIGCNIGLYSLWAAALDRHVLSVEMMMTNVQLLQMSLELSNLTSMVTIVNNAIYKDHRELGVKLISDNIGGNSLDVPNTPDVIDDKAAKLTVKTICMNDLVPLVRNTRVYLKMDIENSEHFALQCADEFFKEVDVKIVQMEWHQRVPENRQVILSFMASRGYNMSRSANSNMYVDMNSIPGDVFFLKVS
ncbi:unnamed protein product [Lymnaea stagnalis]|uniref:Methyltransferase FkbM domain-containing protein n=1 Tax=Lymnaea stagnalis TaxID=6523 RepID=A0AAV2I9A4_LYMST